MNATDTVWIFKGDNAQLPSAVFSNQQNAEDWIKTNRASGILTEYPIDTSVYDWAVSHEYFVPKREHHNTIEFQQQFTSAHQKHVHYKDGIAPE